MGNVPGVKVFSSNHQRSFDFCGVFRVEETGLFRVASRGSLDKLHLSKVLLRALFRSTSFPNFPRQNRELKSGLYPRDS